MEIIELEIDKLKPYDKNAKTHPEEQVRLIANSIKEFGFKTPVLVDENFVIIQGHGRRLASISLGLKTVPCVIADDLSKEQVKMLRLADNKVAESEWDLETLDIELEEMESLFSISDFGFDLNIDDFFVEPLDDGEEQEVKSLLDAVGLDLASITFIFETQQAEEIKEILKGKTPEEKGAIIYKHIKELDFG